MSRDKTTHGTFTLLVDHKRTPPIACDANAQTLQSAIDAVAPGLLKVVGLPRALHVLVLLRDLDTPTPHKRRLTRGRGRQRTR